MSVVSQLWSLASTDRLWLQGNLTWEDVDAMPNYPRRSDLCYSILIAVFLSMLRFLLDRFLFLRLAKTVMVFAQPSKLQQNSILEKAFKQKTVDKKQIQLLARDLNWTVHQLETWLHRRKNVISKQKKFTESAWRFLFYVFSTGYGFYAIWGKPCATNIAACFPPSVRDEIFTDQVRWFCLIEFGFYFSLCASILHDARRKDFNIMIVHHVVTILLLSISWLSNTTNYGSLILVCHDVGDVPLEGAKLCKYLKKIGLANIGFALFLIVWCLSRLIYFPFTIHGIIMYSGTYYSPFLYYVACGLLVSLLCLHVVWTWMIFQVLLTLLKSKEVQDVRSDDETGSSDDEDDKTK